MRKRLVWGLIWVLVAVLVLAPVGYAAMFVRGAEFHSVRLLEPRDWGFGRGISDNNDWAHPVSVEWINLGIATVYRMNHLPSPLDDATASAHGGTGGERVRKNP